MAAKSFFRPLMMALFVGLVNLPATPTGPSLSWGSAHEPPRMTPKRPMMKAPAGAMAEPQVLTTPTPTTLDSYTDYVSNRLQVEAMKVRHQGSADVKLTIDKRGAVKSAEVVRVDGPAALRDEVMAMVKSIEPLPPLPPDANADVLVVTSPVVFNYPGREMFDRYGRRTSDRR